MNIRHTLSRLCSLLLGAALLCGCTAGESAYDIAVRHGFQGSEQMWLESLKAQPDRDNTQTDGATSDGATSDGATRRDVLSVQLDDRGHVMVVYTDGTVTDAGPVEKIESAYPEEEGYTPVVQTVYAVSPVNIRTKPASVAGSSVVGQLHQGDTITRIGINHQDGWSRVVYGEQICYISSRYLEVTVSDAVYDLGDSAPVVCLPDELTVTVGVPFTLYHNAYVANLTDTMYVYCRYSGGDATILTEPDAYTFTEETAGTYTLQVSLMSYLDGLPVTTYRKTLKVTAVEPDQSSEVVGMLIGDSRIADGTMVSALQIAFKSNLTLVGTRTAATCPSEGRSGWSTVNYLNHEKIGSISNPFYSPTVQTDTQSGVQHHFSFAHYMEQTGAPTPDFVVIWLGANDRYTAASADNVRIMAESIRAYGKSVSKDIAVLIMHEYLYPTEHYTLIGNSNVALMRFSQANHFFYLESALGDREDDGIYLVPAHATLDDFSHRRLSKDGTYINDLAHLGYHGYLAQTDVLLSYLYRVLTP